mmetsp:Transcript_14031/g.38780  ORF Transcript_14031/g.38780 Transcript_14031/m.38780 type:complete len:448 (+) Transcript_14031:104-1447(+)
MFLSGLLLHVAVLLQMSATWAWQSPVTTTSTSARRRQHHQQQQVFHRLSSTTAPLDELYYSFIEAPLQTQISANRITLTRYLDQVAKDNPDLQDMVSLLGAVKMACKTISNLVNRAGLVYPDDDDEQGGEDDDIHKDYTVDGRYYSMQRLDQLSTIVLKNALKYTGKCEVTQPERNPHDVAEHQPGVLIAKSIDSNYVACLDPLDGSGNADASICTGTVFGVFEESDNNQEDTHDIVESTMSQKDKLVESVLQPAKNMKAAGYCLYSSATVLVFTLGDTVQGFTLDPQINEFVLTHKNLKIPSRGNVYSCNEANSEGWDASYKDYLLALKYGRGQTGKRYAHRYVGSMVGDIHRTLLYGGIFGYPSDTMDHPDGNLQLLYKTAPMAFVVHKAGGRCIDGRGNSLLDVRPNRVHQKSPCFIGSPDDVNELETFLGRTTHSSPANSLSP